MKEKILSKVEVSIPQEIICQNLNNLSVTLATLSEIDSAIMGKELQKKMEDTKDNLMNAIHYYSTFLQTQE